MSVEQNKQNINSSPETSSGGNDKEKKEQPTHEHKEPLRTPPTGNNEKNTDTNPEDPETPPVFPSPTTTESRNTQHDANPKIKTDKTSSAHAFSENKNSYVHIPLKEEDIYKRYDNTCLLLCFIFGVIKKFIRQKPHDEILRKIKQNPEKFPDQTIEQVYAITIKKGQKPYGTIAYSKKSNLREDLINLVEKGFMTKTMKWKDIQTNDIYTMDIYLEVLIDEPRKLNSLENFNSQKDSGILATYTNNEKTITIMILPSQLNETSRNPQYINTYISERLNNILKQNNPIGYYTPFLTFYTICTTIYNMNYIEYKVVKGGLVTDFNILKNHRLKCRIYEQ